MIEGPFRALLSLNPAEFPEKLPINEALFNDAEVHRKEGKIRLEEAPRGLGRVFVSLMEPHRLPALDGLSLVPGKASGAPLAPERAFRILFAEILRREKLYFFPEPQNLQLSSPAFHEALLLFRAEALLRFAHALLAKKALGLRKLCVIGHRPVVPEGVIGVPAKLHAIGEFFRIILHPHVHAEAGSKKEFAVEPEPGQVDAGICRNPRLAVEVLQGLRVRAAPCGP